MDNTPYYGGAVSNKKVRIVHFNLCHGLNNLTAGSFLRKK